MKKRYLVYIGIVCVILLTPFAGMTFWATDETAENTVLAEWPSLTKDGNLNREYLSGMGEYFEDHFAFRQQLVTANAVLRGKIFKESATPKVVVGTDDWLYFNGTLDDYQGKNLMDERQLSMLTHNLKLIQQYVESQGSGFIFTVAPNKNSLYNENMPFYYQKGNESNLANLTERMKTAGISYLDLYELFQAEEDVLYFQRDSHWNNRGAILAYNALLDYMGKEHETYLNVPYEEEAVHTGDLDEMLYPLAYEPETDYIYDKEWKYRYVNDVTDHMDDWIETVNPGKEGTVLMFRDSFGESLLPFVAEEVGRGYFSRLVPYNLTQTEQYRPNCVVIEKVERNLIDFIEEAPIMEPVQTNVLTAPEAETDSSISTEKAGSYLMIKGQIDETYVSEETEIYVTLRNKQTMETKTYPVFYVMEEKSGNGYQVYLKGSSLQPGDYRISTILQNAGQTMGVASADVTWN